MSDNRTWVREQTNRVRDFYSVYTRGFSADAFRRLFTRDSLPEIGAVIIKAVEQHAQDVRFSDDLTALLARRTGDVRQSGERRGDEPFDTVPPTRGPESRVPPLDVARGGPEPAEGPSPDLPVPGQV